MEKLLEQIAEILDVEEVDKSKKFTDYDEWDSLAALSILSLLNSDYHTAMKAAELREYASIEDFCKDILSRS